MTTRVLDTCVIVNLFRGKNRVAEKVFTDGVGISSVTLAELYYGAEKSPDVNKSKEQIMNFMVDFNIEIFDFGKEESRIYGRLKANLELKGKRLDDIDLMIAATAISNHKVLVTANVKHFGRIEGLELEQG